MGVSTRKVSEITEQLCGSEISASQVSRVASLLDEELEKFRSRPLSGAYPFVYLGRPLREGPRRWAGSGPGHPEGRGSPCFGSP